LGHAPIDFYVELSYNEDHHNLLSAMMLNNNTIVPLDHQLILHVEAQIRSGSRQAGVWIS
jgi:hypothetical protein